MKIYRPIATLIMSAAFSFFGIAKIIAASIVTDADSWDRLGETMWTVIGVLEVAAVISLVLALLPKFRPVGIAAASGLVALTVCAFIFHVSNGDGVADWSPAVIQGAIASSYVIFGVRDLRRQGAQQLVK